MICFFVHFGKKLLNLSNNTSEHILILLKYVIIITLETIMVKNSFTIVVTNNKIITW